MESRDKAALEKIVEEVSSLESLLDGVSEDELSADETMERAAAMTAINIGELAKHLSEAFFSENPDSELRYAAKTRDVYAHGYFSLSFSTVYRTAIEDYPRVKGWILGKIGSGA